MKKLLLLSLAVITFLMSCSKDNPEVPEETKDKVIELELIYGEQYSNFGLNFSLQASSVTGLSNAFKIEGLNQDPQINDKNSKIYNLTLDKIPSKSITYRTSEQVSSFGAFFILTSENKDFNSLPVTLNFKIDGKTTATKNIVLKSTVDGFQGYVLDASQPTKLVETTK